MGKSNARKKRDHYFRNTGRDLSSSRGIAPKFSTHERKNKNKIEKIQTLETKHQKRFLQEKNDEGDAFYYAIFYKKRNHSVDYCDFSRINWKRFEFQLIHRFPLRG